MMTKYFPLTLLTSTHERWIGSHYPADKNQSNIPCFTLSTVLLKLMKFSQSCFQFLSEWEPRSWSSCRKSQWSFWCNTSARRKTSMAQKVHVCKQYFWRAARGWWWQSIFGSLPLWACFPLSGQGKKQSPTHCGCASTAAGIPEQVYCSSIDGSLLLKEAFLGHAIKLHDWKPANCIQSLRNPFGEHQDSLVKIS